MVSNTGNTRLCPYCKEEINVEATKCKHCKSYLQLEQPGHGGTCPYCKEEIKPEAIKCKHCGSFVGPDVLLANRSGLMEPAFRSRNLPANLRRPAQAMAGNWPSPSDFDSCEECQESSIDLGTYTIIFSDTLCWKAEEIVGDDGKPVVVYTSQWVPCAPPKYILNPPPKPLPPFLKR